MSQNKRDLAREVFLRQAWTSVVSEHDDRWIDATINMARQDTAGPLAGAGLALERILGRGVDRRDITDLVRVMQYEVLFRLCYLLGDPGIVDSEFLPASSPPVEWGLFELNENGRPKRQLECLHESVLGMDPTGREMRPRPTTE